LVKITSRSNYKKTVAFPGHKKSSWFSLVLVINLEGKECCYT